MSEAYSHHLMGYSQGPPATLRTDPALDHLRRRAANYLTSFVSQQNGNDHHSPAGLPHLLAQYAILQNLCRAARGAVPNSHESNSKSPVKHQSIDGFLTAAAVHATRPEEMFLLGAYAFPELDAEAQMGIVADFTLKFAHCWHGALPLDSPASYVKALENHMDRRAWFIGVDAKSGEEANRRQMMIEISTGIRQIYSNADTMDALR